MRVFWVSAADVESGGSGGAVYSRALLGLFRAARPGWELVVLNPPTGARPATPARHRLRQVTSLLASLTGGAPARVRFSQYPGLATRVAVAAEAGAPALVVLDGPDVRACARGILEHNVPCLTVVHNIEHRLFADSLTRLPAPARAAFRLLGEPGRYARWERQTWERSSAFIHISLDELAAMPVRRPALFVPPVFGAAPAPAPRPPGPLRLGHLGKLTWWPNRAGLDWFLSRVWPQLEGDVELHIWGLGSEAHDDPTDRVHGHGFARDLAEVWRMSDVMIVPAVAGGGVNVKLCETLHRGKPCLATPMALRGLPPIADPALAVVETSVDWAAALAPDKLTEFAARIPRPDTRRVFDAAAARQRLDDWLGTLGL